MCFLVFWDELFADFTHAYLLLPPASQMRDGHGADENCVLRSITLTPLWWARQVMPEESAIPVGAADLLQPCLQLSAPFESPP